jgi:hypothetical protein
MEHFVLSSLVQLLTRTVKLAWFDSDQAKAIVDECKAFMEKGSPGHYMLGLKILLILVSLLALAGQQCSSTARTRSSSRAAAPAAGG